MYNIFSSGVFPEQITSSKSWTNISPVAKLLQKEGGFSSYCSG